MSTYVKIWYLSRVWWRFSIVSMSALCRVLPIRTLGWSDQTVHRSVPFCERKPFIYFTNKSTLQDRQSCVCASWRCRFFFFDVLPPPPGPSMLTLCYCVDTIGAVYLCHVCKEKVPVSLIVAHVTGNVHNFNYFVRGQSGFASPLSLSVIAVSPCLHFCTPVFLSGPQWPRRTALRMVHQNGL